MKELKYKMEAIKPIEIENTTDIGEKFPKSTDPLSYEWIYRGQPTDSPLKTTLERACDNFDLKTREQRFEFENSLIREFQRRFHHYNIIMPSPKDELECLSVMQHYGAPTRMLDWTYSPYIALYFALAEFSEKPVVWATNLRWIQRSCFSLLKMRNKEYSKLNDTERKQLENFVMKTPTAEEKEFAGNWLRKLKHPEKFVYPATPFNLNIRLTVQKGVFICSGDIGSSFMDNIKNLSGFFDGHENTKDKNIIKFTFKDFNKSKRLDFLRYFLSMNISADSLFPGLEGFARSLNVYHHIIDEIKKSK